MGEFVPIVIPEPEIYALLLAGLGLIGFVTRRGVTDLNSLANLPNNIILETAVINNVGQIAVNQAIPPIPEPETYALLLAGLGLTGFMVRRRKPA